MDNTEHPYGCLPPCTGLFGTASLKTFKLEKTSQLLDPIIKYLKIDSKLFLTEEGKNRFSKLTNNFEIEDFDSQVDNLNIIIVTFNSPLLLQITRDVKINFVGKLSSIGGTLGLFTGFSVMSLIEVFYWAGKIILTTTMMKLGLSSAVSGVGSLRRRRKQLTDSVFF